MLAGALIGGSMALRMVASEVIGWMGGHNFQKDEVLGMSIFVVVAGILLGLAGAVLAMILGRFRHHGRPAPST
jgi:hypothetical protein